VGAQQAVPVERRERRLRVTGKGRLRTASAAGGDQPSGRGSVAHRRRILALDPARRPRAGAQHRDHRVGVAGADRLGERADRLAEAVEVSSGDHGRVSAVAKPATRSASTAPGLDRGELVGVADQHQPASGRTASSSRAIIVSETIEVSSTTTTSCGSRLPRSWRNRVALSGRQPSSRCSVVARSPCSRAVGRRQVRGSLRGPPPGAGRRPCRSARPARCGRPARPARSAAPASGHRRGLAGAGTAGEDRRPPGGRPRRRPAARRTRSGKSRSSARPRARLVDRGRRAGRAGRRGRRDLLLLAW
jgi:hypothetical protein